MEAKYLTPTYESSMLALNELFFLPLPPPTRAENDDQACHLPPLTPCNVILLIYLINAFNYVITLLGSALMLFLSTVELPSEIRKDNLLAKIKLRKKI